MNQASIQRNNQAPIQRKSSSGSFKPIRPPPPPPRRASTGGSGKDSDPEHKTSACSSSRNKPEQKTHTDDSNKYAKNQSSSTEEDDIIILDKHGSGATVVSDMQDSTTSWLNQNEALSSTSKANIMNRYKDYMAGMKIGEEVQLPMKIDEYGNGRLKEAESPSVVSDIQDSTTSWLNQIEDYQSKYKTNHIMNSYKEYME